jgi:hypothetical protein
MALIWIKRLQGVIQNQKCENQRIVISVGRKTARFRTYRSNLGIIAGELGEVPARDGDGPVRLRGMAS